MFRVVWDNGHACGAFPTEYPTEKEAATAGAVWRAEMIAIDPDPQEAAEAYSFEVIEESCKSF